MKIKHLVPVMPVRNGKVNGQDGVKLAGFYSDNGADAILVFDLSDSDEEHEKNILLLKEMDAGWKSLSMQVVIFVVWRM